MFNQSSDLFALTFLAIIDVFRRGDFKLSLSTQMISEYRNYFGAKRCSKMIEFLRISLFEFANLPEALSKE
jgi:hypothetical protein